MKKSIANDVHSLVIAAASTNNDIGHKSVRFPPEDRYYDSNEWYALSKNEKVNFLKSRKNINGGKKSTKSGGQPNSGRCSNNEHGKWKSKFDMLDNKFRNQKRHLSFFNTATKPGSDYE